MNMKLENIIKQVISEAVTPVQFLMKAIKSLGKKGAVEAENALIRAIRKESNLSSKATVDVYNISEDILNKSVKNVEFAAYRKLIAQKLYNGNQEIFDDIISKSTGKTRVLQLNNAGIPPAFQEEVRNLSNLKRRTVKPKVEPVKPSETTPTSTSVVSDITDEELWNKLVTDFKSYNVPIKLTREQQVHFIQQIKPEIDKLYKEIEPTLSKKFDEIYFRYQKLTPEKRQLAIKEAQKIIKEKGIGLKGYEKYVFNLKEYILESLKKSKESGWKSLKYNVILTIAGVAFEALSNKIKTNEWDVENVFGFSFKQNVLFKSLLGFVSVFTNGLPSFIFALSSALMSAISSVSALAGPDVSVNKKDSTSKTIFGDNPPSEDELNNLDNN